MNWIQRLNRAIRYVESNLSGDLTPQDVAAKANMSSFHFQRTFSVVTGVTLAEYIRRRKLTLAARELMEGERILDTAVKYGYESQASFTRAYRNMHGFTPGTTRNPGVTVKAYPPLVFNLTIQGEHSMDYEIRNIGEITVAGEMRPISSKDGENYKVIPQFWQDVMTDGSFGKLMKKADPKGVLRGAGLGICIDYSEEQEEFNYIIGMEPAAGTDLGALTVRTIPAFTWAVFRGEDPLPDGIQKLWKRIFSEWFPATEYSHVDGPELELYFDPIKEGGNMRYEVWIPVEKS